MPISHMVHHSIDIFFVDSNFEILFLSGVVLCFQVSTVYYFNKKKIFSVKFLSSHCFLKKTNVTKYQFLSGQMKWTVCVKLKVIPTQPPNVIQPIVSFPTAFAQQTEPKV